MSDLKQIIDNLVQDSSLRLVAQTYSEVAVSKLQRIRGRIEQNRKFVEEIAQLYFLVKDAAPPNSRQQKKEKGTLSLLLTSNHRFYGDLEEQLIKLFVAHTPEFPTDRMVVGKTGVDYLNGVKYTQTFSPLLFKDDLPKQEELEKLIGVLKQYQRVFIYFPKFKTVLIQQPSFVDITGEPPLAKPETNGRVFYYIFEPEVGEMLKFIESQFTTLLMEQAILEAELARTAARLTSMETAQRNADTLIKAERIEIGRANRWMDEMRQSEMVVALYAQNALIEETKVKSGRQTGNSLH